MSRPQTWFPRFDQIRAAMKREMKKEKIQKEGYMPSSMMPSLNQANGIKSDPDIKQQQEMQFKSDPSQAGQ